MAKKITRTVTTTTVHGVTIDNQGEVTHVGAILNGKYDVEKAQSLVRKDDNRFSATGVTHTETTYTMDMGTFMTLAEVTDVKEVD